jgi:DNA-binding SARP family transcriptional activator
VLPCRLPLPPPAPSPALRSAPPCSGTATTGSDERGQSLNGIDVRLFGKVAVLRDGRPVSVLSTKALELFCYLLLFRDRAHAREVLSDVLWPDASEPLSKKYLRQTLWQLRTTLNEPGGGRAGAESLIAASLGWVRINPDAGWWLDVDAFERAYRACRDIGGEDLTDRQAQALDEAAVLYRGDLIESWYQDWCIYERDRLQLIYLAMLEKLMEYCDANRLFAKGVAYGHSILRYDAAREATHRRLMRLYYGAGDRGNALRQYDRCVAVLAKQFDLRPSPETVALHQHLRGGRPEMPPGRQVAGQRVDADLRATGELLLDIRSRMDELRDGLYALQKQVSELTALTALGRLPQQPADGRGDGRRDGARYNGS